MQGHRLVVALAFAGIAAAATVAPGDLIAVDFGNRTLDDINPTTGASFVIASGFTNPQGLAIASSGTIFVSDIGTSTIDEVNPVTEAVRIFSGGGVGAGLLLNRPFQMAFSSSGILYVVDGGVSNGNTTALLSIDANGNRTPLASNAGASNHLSGGALTGLALASTYGIYTSAPNARTVYSAGPWTATPLISNAALSPQGLAVSADGRLLVANGNPSNPEILSVDPGSGNSTILSDNSGAGAGPAFDILRGLAVAPESSIYAADIGDNRIYRIDPVTGNRSVLSGNGIGGSTFGGLTYGIAVYPAPASPSPELSGILLFAPRIAGLTFTAARTGAADESL